MPNLSFTVKSAEPLSYAASPQIIFKLGITNADPDEQIQNVMLQCQIQIETVRRRYGDDEKANLVELYGEPERWGTTLKTMLWTHANVTVRPFTGEVEMDMPVHCTYDFNVAATKYFDGLRGGDVPLCFLFSGTVFYRDEHDALQVSQISWENEASFRLPVSVWKGMMTHYYPNSAWINLRKDVFDSLLMYRVRNSIPSWEKLFEELLPSEEPPAASNGHGQKFIERDSL